MFYTIRLSVVLFLFLKKNFHLKRFRYPQLVCYIKLTVFKCEAVLYSIVTAADPSSYHLT